MQEWEYKVLSDIQTTYTYTEGEDLPSGKMENFLNEHGVAGWELISVTWEGRERRFFFKRPKTGGVQSDGREG